MTEPTLREVLENKIQALDDRIDIRLCSMTRALELQAKEYERRLTDLNHEQARLQLDRERYLQNAVFNEYRGETDKWKVTVNDFVARNAGRDHGVSIVWAGLIAALGVLISIAAYFKGP